MFAALFAFAQNSDIEGPSDVGISAGFMIAVATIVVFATERTPLGAVLVGLAGVLFVPHLVHREWRKILCNAGAHALSMFAGVAVLLAFPPSWLTSFPGLLIAAFACRAGRTSSRTSCSVGLGIAYAQKRPPRDVLLRDGRLAVAPLPVRTRRHRSRLARRFTRVPWCSLWP